MFICNEYMNLWRLSNGELNLANTSTITPEKGKVGTLLEKSLDLELNEERKSLPKWYIRPGTSVKVQFTTKGSDGRLL